MNRSDSPIRLIPTGRRQGQNGACQELIKDLNKELAAEYRAIIALGTLVALFRAEVADRQQRVKFLTETVAELGGSRPMFRRLRRLRAFHTSCEKRLTGATCSLGTRRMAEGMPNPRCPWRNMAGGEVNGLRT